MRCVNETLPPRARARWLLITMRLSASSLAGTARTLVAVGTVSDAFMFLTTAAAAPRSGVCTGPPEVFAVAAEPPSARGCGAGFGAAGAAAGGRAAAGRRLALRCRGGVVGAQRLRGRAVARRGLARCGERVARRRPGRRQAGGRRGLRTGLAVGAGRHRAARAVVGEELVPRLVHA